jgi:hypothetical protein
MGQKIDKLSDHEQLSICWFKAHHPAWRQRLAESRAEYESRRPEKVAPEIWSIWYDCPFGDDHFNSLVQAARRVFNEGRI